MNVLFVTDPLEGLRADIDATIGLMAATQAESDAVWACRPEQLSVVNGRVIARAARIVLRPRTPRGGDHTWQVDRTWFDQVEQALLDVTAATDLVMLRIDPPVESRYLHTTYLLDLVEDAGVRVVNRPAGVRAIHEKVIALQLPELCPATLVSTDPSELRGFLAQVGTAVVKPVDGFAGADVWLLRDEDSSATALLESATHAGRRHVLAQAYLPAVAAGNKRLFVLDGEIIGAVLRRPSEDDFRIGPPVARADIDPDDLSLVEALAPRLARHGLAVAGIDVIDGRLIEVNVTCPGGMHKADGLLGTDLSGAIMRRLLHHERAPA